MKRLEILLPGRRKAVYGTAAFVAMCIHAALTKADFVQFANAMQWWLGIMVTSHVVQQATTKSPAQEKPS
jgi:hypothetical protein